MGRTLDQVMASLPQKRQDKINKEADRILNSLQTIREIQDLTQTDIAKAIGRTQGAISQLEKRGDMRVSTLREFINATGGELDLVVRWPNGLTITLDTLNRDDNGNPASA